jgi:hypothetical protein
LLYNTQKVEQKEAVFLDAHNFWQEKDDLTPRDIQQRFKDLTMLNERSNKKIIHISVNFHPDDNLTDKAMAHLAEEFMKGIDFGEQPWLTFRHNDAGHPHIHIVSTNIRPDGSRILNDLRSPSNLTSICSEIEKKHSLKAALAPHQDLSYPNRNSVPSLKYGEMPTRTGIGMVLDYVSENYNFTSFESFNAILSLYNVRADRGNPEGIMYQNRGLYYRMIDSEGKKLGAPIKASDFHHDMTLDALEKKYQLNQQRVTEEHRRSMRLRIDWHLFNPPASLGEFVDNMASDRKQVIIPAFTRRETKGNTPVDRPGMFYVDFEKMIVFRDTELGENYTAEAILKRSGLDKAIPEMVRQQQLELKPGERTLLNEPDLGDNRTRDLLLRLSAEHDRAVEQQKAAERLTQSHRLGLHL